MNKISGGTFSAYLKHDSLYISSLIRIKKPKVVVCLGMETFFNLVSAFVDDSNVLEDINENFWKSLDSGKNYRTISCDGLSLRMYGVSHAGSNGAMNRKKNCSLKNHMHMFRQALMNSILTDIVWN